MSHHPTSAPVRHDPPQLGIDASAVEVAGVVAAVRFASLLAFAHRPMGTQF